MARREHCCPLPSSSSSSSASLPVCIVEDHCDILFFIAALYRAKIPPLYNHDDKYTDNSSLLLLHFDAHPDLAAPSHTPCRVQDFSNLSILAEILSGEGGIAEFLLPPCYTGLIEEVVWVKPSWANQFEAGNYSFLLGNATTSDDDYEQEGKGKEETITQRVGVSLLHPYYTDEGQVYGEDELEATKRINFRVVNASSSSISLEDLSNVKRKEEDMKPFSSSSPNWVLDICLDFFTTRNPFLDEFMKYVKKDIEDEDTFKATLDSLRGIFPLFRYRSCQEAKLSRLQRSVAMKHLRDIVSQLNEEKREVSSSLLEALAKDLEPHHDNDSVALIGSYVKALRRLSPQSRTFYLSSGHLLNMPHHASSPDELEASFAIMMQQLKGMSRPIAVTIARSAVDGYTPKEVVDSLQARVLEMLEKELFPHWNSSFSREEENGTGYNVHDLRENAFEKCMALPAALRAPRSKSNIMAVKRRRVLNETNLFVVSADP